MQLAKWVGTRRGLNTGWICVWSRSCPFALSGIIRTCAQAHHARIQDIINSHTWSQVCDCAIVICEARVHQPFKLLLSESDVCRCWRLQKALFDWTNRAAVAEFWLPKGWGSRRVQCMLWQSRVRHILTNGVVYIRRSTERTWQNQDRWSSFFYTFSLISLIERCRLSGATSRRPSFTLRIRINGVIFIFVWWRCLIEESCLCLFVWFTQYTLDKTPDKVFNIWLTWTQTMVSVDLC